MSDIKQPFIASLPGLFKMLTKPKTIPGFLLVIWKLPLVNNRNETDLYGIPDSNSAKRQQQLSNSKFVCFVHNFRGMWVSWWVSCRSSSSCVQPCRRPKLFWRSSWLTHGRAAPHFGTLRGTISFCGKQSWMWKRWVGFLTPLHFSSTCQALPRPLICGPRVLRNGTPRGNEWRSSWRWMWPWRRTWGAVAPSPPPCTKASSILNPTLRRSWWSWLVSVPAYVSLPFTLDILINW